MFLEHNQPRIPLNNRYYNLLNIENMQWQIKLAKQYGIFLNYDVKDVSCGFKAFHLESWVFDVIEHSDSYSFIFDIISKALIDKKKISCVNIDCIYHYEEFQYTKSAEIISYIKCLRRYLSKTLYTELKLGRLYDEIANHVDFVYDIEEYKFWGFYIQGVDGYIVQTNPSELFKYFGSST